MSTQKLLAFSIISLLLTVPPAYADNPRILMILWKGETMAEKAFKERLQALGVQADYESIDANQNRSALGGSLREKVPDIGAKKYAALYAYGTVSAQMAKAAVPSDIPIVFNIVFDPVGGGLVTSKEQPGGNLTGVINGVPIATQFEVFRKLKPIKKLVVLFNSREPNSNIIEQDVKAWAGQHGVEVVSRRIVPDSNSLAETLEEITSGKLTGDTLYAGADNYLASVAKPIATAASDKFNLYGGTQTYVWRGWLGAYTPEVADMGNAAAEQMAKILKGASPATTPVILPTPKLFLSKDEAARHDITPPEDAVLETGDDPANPARS
jgi:putative tryptophan/tyrosine transport system substrate-binding protein